MGWFFRKSINFGPFRLNLSKSGLGVSAGVKGARVSVGPKGTQLRMGKGPLYYHKTLSGAGGASQVLPPITKNNELGSTEPRPDHFPRYSDNYSEVVRLLGAPRNGAEYLKDTVPKLVLYYTDGSAVILTYDIDHPGDREHTHYIGVKQLHPERVVHAVDRSWANFLNEYRVLSPERSVGDANRDYFAAARASPADNTTRNLIIIGIAAIVGTIILGVYSVNNLPKPPEPQRAIAIQPSPIPTPTPTPVTKKRRRR